MTGSGVSSGVIGSCGHGRVKKLNQKKNEPKHHSHPGQACPDPSARMRPNNCPGNPGSVVSGKPRQTPNAHIDLHPRESHPQSTPAVCHDYGNLQQTACKRRRLQSAPTSPKVRPEQEKHHHTLSPSVYLSAAAAPAPCTPRGSCSCNAQCCFRS